jgi:hypothetical protein
MASSPPPPPPSSGSTGYGDDLEYSAARQQFIAANADSGALLKATAVDFTRTMTAGAQGASVFNNAITIGSKYLTNFISDIPIVGGVLKTLGNSAAAYVAQVNNQSDKLFRSFQDLSKVGGSSAAGMQGVIDGMQQLGYTLEDLDKYKSVISENSALMSSLGGTVSQGIKAFGSISSGLQQTGLQTEFLRMGMTVEDINKGQANYLKIQQQTGQLQGKTTQQLTDGTAEYLRKQSELSRLTGLSVDQLAKKYEEDLKNERYQATMTELKMKAAAGDKDSANKLAYYTELVQKAATMPEEVREGIRDTISGFGQQTEAGQKFARMSAGAADMIAKGAGTVDSALGTLGSDAQRQREATAGYVRAVGDQSTFFKQSTLLAVEAFNQSGKSATANSEAAKEEAAALRDGKNVDINNQVLMRQAQVATTTGLQDLVQLGVHPVTAAMVKFATTTENIVTAIPGVGDKTRELKNLRTTNPQTNQPISGQTGFGGYNIDPQIVKNNEATLKGIQTNMAGFEQVLRRYNEILDPERLLDNVRRGTPTPAAPVANTRPSTSSAGTAGTADIIRNAQGNAAPTSNVANFNANQVAALMSQANAAPITTKPTFDAEQLAGLIAKGNADLKSNTSTLNAEQVARLIAQGNADLKSTTSTLNSEQVAGLIAQGNADLKSNTSTLNAEQVARLIAQGNADLKSTTSTLNSEQVAGLIAQGNADLKSTIATLDAKQTSDLTAQKNVAPTSNKPTLSSEQVAGLIARGNDDLKSNISTLSVEQVSGLIARGNDDLKSNISTLSVEQVSGLIARGNDDLKSNISSLNTKQIVELTSQKNDVAKSNTPTPSAEQIAARVGSIIKDQSEAILAQMKAPVEQNRQPTPTGPRERSPTRLEENRPENDIREERAAPQNTNVLASSLNQGFIELASSISQQTRSMDDLVELMRKSVGVQGRILQQART